MMPRLIIVGLFLFLFSCIPRSNEQSLVEQLTGEWIYFDTLNHSSDLGSNKELLEFKSDSYEYKTYFDSFLVISKGKYFTIENKLRNNNILVLVPEFQAEENGDSIIDSPLYYEILNLNDSALFLRSPSGLQSYYIGGKRKFKHGIQIFKLKLR